MIKQIYNKQKRIINKHYLQIKKNKKKHKHNNKN